jgi:hypothetical protein
MLYEGKQANANTARGINLLKNAVASVDWSAKAYLELCVDDKFAKRLRRQFLDNFGPFLSATVSTKLGRNDPCQCGAGRKLKKCCGARAFAPEEIVIIGWVRFWPKIHDTPFWLGDRLGLLKRWFFVVLSSE